MNIGTGRAALRPEDFADPKAFFRFWRHPHGFDILPYIPGVDFDEAWERRVETAVGTKSGLKLPVSLFAIPKSRARKISLTLKDYRVSVLSPSAIRREPTCGLIAILGINCASAGIQRLK
jgi:hypothetical protein